MAKNNKLELVTRGLIKENPVLRLVLGTCPTLAVTTMAVNGLGRILGHLNTLKDPCFNGDLIQRELHKAIGSLPQKQRLVFNLRYFDEMKYEDISQITGTSTGALKASYHHAYNKLKEELQKNIP